MKSQLFAIAALACGLSLAAHAETSLVYELTDSQGKTTEQTYTLHGRWVRVDYNVPDAPRHLILDTGFLIMYVVDSAQESFFTFGQSPHHQGEQLASTAGQQAAPQRMVERGSAAATLAPTGQRESVAGIRCNLVDEVVDGKTVAEHCLADPAVLGMSQREMITMARLIDFAREWSDPDWIAIQRNEQFVSIRSRPADGVATFVLKSVSHTTPPADYFRVPASYRKRETGSDYRGLLTGSK
ncbi:MAG: hypothetical protein R3F42_00270 [Pseudomonadota bacterium]